MVKEDLFDVVTFEQRLKQDVSSQECLGFAGVTNSVFLTHIDVQLGLVKALPANERWGREVVYHLGAVPSGTCGLPDPDKRAGGWRVKQYNYIPLNPPLEVTCPLCSHAIGL